MTFEQVQKSAVVYPQKSFFGDAVPDSWEAYVLFGGERIEGWGPTPQKAITNLWQNCRKWMRDNA